MNKVTRVLKNLLYSLPFGLKGADDEIAGTGEMDADGTNIRQQISDKRVAKHLLKGELTQEVKELRYRTYKVGRESDKYSYVGNGMAVKKEENKKEKTNIIKFTQENKLICNDILTELNRVGGYGVENYSVHIDYNAPVRFKFEEFIKYVDVLVKDGEKAVTVLRFDDIPNPSSFNSKPFIGELEKLDALFSKKDAYGLSRNDFATSILGMGFVTFKATDSEPDIVSYAFLTPKLISVAHENGEFKLTYEWDTFTRADLTDKFYMKELDEKYKNKERKEIRVEDKIVENNEYFEERYGQTIKCSKCGRDIRVFSEGYMADTKTGEPICVECFQKSLLEEK